jgi:cobalt-zinc-cadmium resistance protein CzcA
VNNLIDKLISTAFRNRYITLAIIFLLLVVGYGAFRALEIEAYPDFTNPQVRVITILPGKAAEEMERLVTIPLEKELNGIPGEISLRSTSFINLSVIIVTFEDGLPSQVTRQEVLERINQADIPGDAKPQLDSDSSSVGEIYRYTVESKYYSAMERKSIEDWDLEKAFRQIPGVIDVTSWGGPIKTYQVNVDPVRLKALGLSIDQVYQALSNANATTGANYIEKSGQAFVVRSLGLLKNISDINHVVVTSTANGTPIRVEDVATVDIGSGIRLGQYGKNRDDDDVMGIVMLLRGENPSRVVERLYKKFPEIQNSLPRGVKLVPLYDRLQLVRETLHTVFHNLGEGITLVVIVLIVFLFDFTSGLIAATVIPLALLFSFICLNLFHIPANLLSLGAIDFGIIVDGAVVMVENAFSRLSEASHHLKDRKSRNRLVLEAVQQVGRPILFATSIICCCFLVLFAFNGVAGKLFRPLAFTMNFQLLGAVLIALTFIPVLISFFMTHKPITERESPVVILVRAIYRPILRWTIAHPLPVIAAALAALACAVVLFLHTGSEFLPALEEGNIWLRATVLPPSISLEEGVVVAHRIREILLQYPELKNVTSQTGSPDDATDPNLFSNIEFLVDLKPPEQWRTQFHRHKEELISAMNKDLSTIPNVDYNFSQYIQDNVDEAISGAKGNLGIKIFGPDINVLQRLGDQITNIVTQVPGMVDVADDHLVGQPQYQVIVDREAASRYGLNVSDVQNLIAESVGGKVATQLVEGERRFDVLVRLSKPYRDTKEAIDNLLINPPGPIGTIPISLVAHTQAESGALIINREENKRLMIVKANVRGRDLGSAVVEAQQKIAQQVHLPEEYEINWGGQYEYQQESNQRLVVVVFITLGLIFFILLLAFGSISHALLILVAIPLAAIGGVVGLFVTHTYFSISAGIGFIALTGVAVQNGVIMVSFIDQLLQRYINQLSQLSQLSDISDVAISPSINSQVVYTTLIKMAVQDYSLKRIKYTKLLYTKQELIPYLITQATYKGALSRMRPVLMTATVAILGLLPVATSNGIGSQTQKPFAIVIISGLISATFLTLLVLPALYNLVEKNTNKHLKPRQEETDDPVDELTLASVS